MWRNKRVAFGWTLLLHNSDAATEATFDKFIGFDMLPYPYPLLCQTHTSVLRMTRIKWMGRMLRCFFNHKRKSEKSHVPFRIPWPRMPITVLSFSIGWLLQKKPKGVPKKKWGLWNFEKSLISGDISSMTNKLWTALGLIVGPICSLHFELYAVQNLDRTSKIDPSKHVFESMFMVWNSSISYPHG
jgi:hypothetical protein